jgi:hypothetical protein
MTGQVPHASLVDALPWPAAFPELAIHDHAVATFQLQPLIGD